MLHFSSFVFLSVLQLEYSLWSISSEFIYLSLFIYLWLCWVFVAVCGLSLVVVSRGSSSLRCAGFSLWWLLSLQSTGSRHAGLSSCGTQAVDRRLSSCGTRAQLLCVMWDLPGPGLKPVSPALAGRFLTTVLPGKSSSEFLKFQLLYFLTPEFPLGSFISFKIISISLLILFV